MLREAFERTVEDRILAGVITRREDAVQHQAEGPHPLHGGDLRDGRPRDERELGLGPMIAPPATAL